jgi:hypothetical protein
VMLFTKVAEKTPSLAKINMGAHFVVIAKINSVYVTRGCIGYGDQTCHVCIEVMDFMNCWKCSAPICNTDKKSCSEQCHSCEHLLCDRCW